VTKECPSRESVFEAASFAKVPRQPRNLLPDGIFHVTARAVADELLFADDYDRKRFLWLLNGYCVEYGIRRRAYCLLGTHYHLLLEGSTANLSRLMHRLNSRYAQRYNERHDRSGHLFSERYTVRVIRDEQQLSDTYAYLDANPAKAGLCGWDERWPWSWADTPAAA
jgi:REP element-mobilizing transposase RayT